MDGLERRLKESVQFRLSLALSLAILAIAVVAGVCSFVTALAEAHDLQDDVLDQIAALVDRQGLAPGAAMRDFASADDDENERVIVQELPRGRFAQPPAHAASALPLPSTLGDGFHTLNLNGDSYRVLVSQTAAGPRIAVAQSSRFRDEIAFDSAVRSVLPLLVLVPLLLWIVARLVQRMFRPISQLSREVDQRTEQDLRPVDDGHLPAEVRPFVVAINRLLGRVAQSMESQRRFVADAAHELRSPMTALSLQAERLSHAEMSGVARERLGQLRQGIERGRNLLEQLLALARAQSPPPRPPEAPVPVQQVFRRVLEDLMPLADARQIDVGVGTSRHADVWANELDLLALLRNLVDNAIRYSPPGGKVDLGVDEVEGKVVLSVRDSGPGIPWAERSRVFDPFYRILGTAQPGSGLGLSIVKAIADRLGAEVSMGFADEGRQQGWGVSIRLPAAGRPA